MAEIPAPGSLEAIQQGCKCPVHTLEPEAGYMIDNTCMVHTFPVILGAYTVLGCTHHRVNIARQYEGGVWWGSVDQLTDDDLGGYLRQEARRACIGFLILYGHLRPADFRAPTPRAAEPMPDAQLADVLLIAETGVQVGP